MEIGMSIPSTIEGADRETLCTWIRRVDAGPFSLLATGERIASPFLDLMGVLSAAAVLTERVTIEALISLAPLHNPVILAKQAATIDVLSEGRFKMGVGVGMREYDYELAGKSSLFPNRLDALDETVVSMRRIWQGNYSLPKGAPPLGPRPVHPGGPELFASSLGPLSMRRAARWADGFAGFHMGPNLRQIDTVFSQFRAAWSDSERPGEAPLQMAFWFGLVDDAPRRVQRFARDYLTIFGDKFAQEQSQKCTATNQERLRATLTGLRDMGCGTAILTPTTASLDELSAAEDLIASL